MLEDFEVDLHCWEGLQRRSRTNKNCRISAILDQVIALEEKAGSKVQCNMYTTVCFSPHIEMLAYLSEGYWSFLSTPRTAQLIIVSFWADES